MYITKKRLEQNFGFLSYPKLVLIKRRHVFGVSCTMTQIGGWLGMFYDTDKDLHEGFQYYNLCHESIEKPMVTLLTDCFNKTVTVRHFYTLGFNRVVLVNCN